MLDSCLKETKIFRKAYKRGLCCHVFKVVELIINDADRNYFSVSHHTYCLYPSCLNKDHVAYSSPLEAEDTTTYCRR